MHKFFYKIFIFVTIFSLTSFNVMICNAAKQIVIAGKDFTEQVILLELTRQLLSDRGYHVEKLSGLSTSQLHQYMKLRTADIYWEYTSTRLLLAYGQADKFLEETGFDKVKELDRANGYVWLKASKINNKYALAMMNKKSHEFGISRLSDLSDFLRSGKSIKFGFNDEFAERPDGLVPLKQAYGLDIPQSSITDIESDRIYNALRVYWIDVGVVFSTDGRIAEYNFHLLDDDKKFFYNYILAPVIKKETVETYPDIVNILENLSSRLDNATMTRLNAEADIGRRLVKDVASDFLKKSGLIKP